MTETTPLLQQPAQKTEFLLQYARSGHQAAWKALYERYRRMLLVKVECRMPGFLRRRLDADDVLQEAFSKAWAKIDSFQYEGEGSFRRWLAKIVLHEFWNSVRTTETERDHALDTQAMGEAVANLEEDSARAPSQILSLAESKARLLQKLGELTEDDQDLIILRMFERKEWTTIGEILGCSRTLARERFDRALGRLARSMG